MRYGGLNRLPKVFAFVPTPADMLALTRLIMNACFLIIPTPPFAYSLQQNSIGAEGATKLAAVLKETKISELKCAAAP